MAARADSQPRREPGDWAALESRSGEELAAHRDARVRDLVAHAARHVPYYRRLWRTHGIDPARIDSADRLEELPLLSRAALRAAVHDRSLLADNISWRRRVARQTTGSTGMPLRFFGDTASDDPRARAWHLLNRWAGVQSADRRVWLSVPRPRPRWSWAHPRWSWREVVGFRQPPDLVSIQRLTEADLPRVLGAMPAADDYYVYGIASAITFIAGHASDLGLPLARPARAVIGSSDTFTAPMRDRVGRFFGGPVFSRYGAYEIGGGVAQTCPDNPLVHHVVPELVHVEVLDEHDRPVPAGTAGRLVVTDLTNEVMPLIRYDIGDATSAERCACGRAWAAFGEVYGRTADVLIAADGTRRAAWELEIAFFYRHDFSAVISEYRFVQRELGHVELLVVPRRPLRRDDVAAMTSAVRSVLGAAMAVTVTARAQIGVSPSGKRKLAVSMLDPPAAP